MRHQRTLALRLATRSSPRSASPSECELPHSRLLASRRCHRCLQCKDARASIRWRNSSRKRARSLRRTNWQESQRGTSNLDSIRRSSQPGCPRRNARTRARRRVARRVVTLNRLRSHGRAAQFLAPLARRAFARRIEDARKSTGWRSVSRRRARRLTHPNGQGSPRGTSSPASIRRRSRRARRSGRRSEFASLDRACRA